MGSKSYNGWWKRIFRRGNRTQAETWNEQLGSYPPGPFYGQTSFAIDYLKTKTYDDELDLDIDVYYTCACDELIYKMGASNGYACIHCDSICEQENCSVCQALNEARRY